MNVENLPDFDELVALTGEIGGLKTGLMVDKTSLEKLEADITGMVTEDPAYFVRNKPPSMSYIKAHYHALGCNEETKREIAVLKSSIAESEGQLREKELLFQVYRDMIDVWRTESANKRGSFYEGS